MTVALGDAALLCNMLQPLPDLGDAAATAAATAAFYSKRTPLSSTINTLANALYQVMHSMITMHPPHCTIVCVACEAALQNHPPMPLSGTSAASPPWHTAGLGAEALQHTTI